MSINTWNMCFKNKKEFKCTKFINIWYYKEKIKDCTTSACIKKEIRQEHSVRKVVKSTK